LREITVVSTIYGNYQIMSKRKEGKNMEILITFNKSNE